MFFNVLAKCAGYTIPDAIASLTTAIYTIIKVAVPLILIIMGMLDLGKAVISQKDEEIKKQQGLFVKRLIAAALVFFVFAIVQLLVGIVADETDNKNIMNCIKDLLGA